MKPTLASALRFDCAFAARGLSAAPLGGSTRVFTHRN